MANTEFDGYNTNIDSDILDKILSVALDPITDTIMISKIVLKHLPT